MPADDVRTLIAQLEAVKEHLRVAMRDTDIDAGTWGLMSQARDEALCALYTLRWFGVGAIHMNVTAADAAE